MARRSVLRVSSNTQKSNNKEGPVLAKITLPSYIKEGHGRMDDAVITKWKGVTLMKPYRKPSGVSDKQAEVRMAFKSLVADWKYLGGIIQVSWEKSVAGMSLTGFNAFMGANVVRRRAGEPMELCPAMGEELLMNFAAAPGAAAGTVACSFLPPVTGRHVTFFSRKVADAGLASEIRRHEAGASPVSPFTITGLESGAQYHLYAAVTDAAYDTAKTISASVAAVSAAA